MNGFLYKILVVKLLSVYLIRRKISGENMIDREELEIALLFLRKKRYTRSNMSLDRLGRNYDNEIQFQRKKNITRDVL